MSEQQNSNLIAYCGLYCGDCFGHKGDIADLARDLRKKLRQAKFDRVAQGLSAHFKEFNNYQQCYEVLGALVRLRCKAACHKGGGPPFCKIRICCQNKDIPGCWECQDFEFCDKLDFLEPTHGDAHHQNLKKIARQGVDKFLAGKRLW